MCARKSKLITQIHLVHLIQVEYFSINHSILLAILLVYLMEWDPDSNHGGEGELNLFYIFIIFLVQRLQVGCIMNIPNDLSFSYLFV